MTKNEWIYLFQYNKWTLGYIKTSEKDSSLCFFLIPKGFVAPSGVKVKVIGTGSGSSATYVEDILESSYAGNSYTTEQFASLEKLGVVALPCGGQRSGASVSDIGLSGYYWSSRCCISSTIGSSFYFKSSFVRSASEYSFSSRLEIWSDALRSSYGLSVRLVQNVQ